MTKALVAGGGGFIGGHLARRLIDQGYEVTVADIKPIGQWEQVHDGVDVNLSRWDLSQWDMAREACDGQDEIYMLAADMGGMGYIETHRYECMLSGLISMHMVKAAVEAGVGRYFYSSSACFVAGVPVTTRDGIKKIEEVKVGDQVLTHTGRFRRVTDTMRRRHTGAAVNLSTRGLPPVICTEDHRMFSGSEWVPAANAEVVVGQGVENGGDPIFTLGLVDPLISCFHEVQREAVKHQRGPQSLSAIQKRWGVSPVTITKMGRGEFPGRCDPVGVESVVKDFDLGWVMGLYLAEGWIENSSTPGGQRRITFALGPTEQEFYERVQRVLEDKFKIPPERVVSYEIEGQQGFKFHVTSDILADLMERCFYDEGRRSFDKTLRQPIWDSPRSFLHGLLCGWWDGDGCHNDRGAGRGYRLTAATTSWKLAHAMRTVMYTFGLDSSIQVVPEREATICGRGVSCKEIYNLYVVGDGSGEDAHKILLGGESEVSSHLKRVRPTSLFIDCDVFNLEVEEDHSYVVQGWSAHNCVYAADKQTDPDATALKESDAYPAMAERGYGWEKLVAEQLATEARVEKGLETRIARFHNVYGPNTHWRGGREKAPAAICRKVATAAISGEHQIEIWGDGTATRSFMEVGDCVEGIQRIMRSDILDPINLGSSELVSVNELVSIVEDIAGVELERSYDPTAPQGVRGRNSDNTLIQARLGWEPNTPLRAGLEWLYEWVYSEVERTWMQGV